jgi:hypothetical protein
LLTRFIVVEPPEEFTVAGLNVAVAPEGSPLTLKLTIPGDPVPGFTVIVKLVFAPVAMVCVPGEAERVKAGATVMVTAAGLGSVAPALSVTVSEAL